MIDVSDFAREVLAMGERLREAFGFSRGEFNLYADFPPGRVRRWNLKLTGTDVDAEFFELYVSFSRVSRGRVLWTAKASDMSGEEYDEGTLSDDDASAYDPSFYETKAKEVFAKLDPYGWDADWNS